MCPETWIFIVFSFSWTHHTFSSGKKLQIVIPRRLWAVCGLCRCCSASPTALAQLTSDQVTRGNKPRFRITIFSPFRTPGLRPYSEWKTQVGMSLDRLTWKAKNRTVLCRRVRIHRELVRLQRFHRITAPSLDENNTYHFDPYRWQVLLRLGSLL